jgi:hypothetical protein
MQSASGAAFWTFTLVLRNYNACTRRVRCKARVQCGTGFFIVAVLTDACCTALLGSCVPISLSMCIDIIRMFNDGVWAGSEQRM